jgi:TetR/AcrR family transcriptional regulator
VPADARRRQILEVAAEMFANRGFAGTTTRDIAAAARTTETVLFRHFPTKVSLYAAILEHRVPAADVERWLKELEPIAERKDDEALFKAVVTVILESFRQDIVYHRLMLFASLEGHELARLVHAKYSGPFLSTLREYVSTRQREGAFKQMRAEWVVHVLVATTTYFALWNALGINPLGLSEREVMTQAVRLLGGMKSP